MSVLSPCPRVPRFRVFLARRIQVADLSDRWKRDLDDFAVGAFHLDAWRRQGLSRFQAANNAAYALAVNSYYLDIVFAVQQPERCQSFGYFHDVSVSFGLR